MKTMKFPSSPVLGRLDGLEIRLAITQAEVRAAQHLRFQVFYEEMGARCDAGTMQSKRDEDSFDEYCDHLLVMDGPVVVGTSRLLLDINAKRAGRYYSQTEFDLTKLLASSPQLQLLELGRSCVLPAYRNRRTVELLWHGTWAFALQNKIGIMFGCASFIGTDPNKFLSSFSWLNQHAVLPGVEDCPAQSAKSIKFSDLIDKLQDNKKAIAGLPPLLKGYLRVGAKVASQAVIDHQFKTIDVLVVLKTAEINPRYISHFGVDASRFAA